LLDHGRAGVLFEAGNADHLARAMNDLWHDAALRARVTMAARQRLVSNHTEEGYLSDLMAIYQRARCA
jgi:glycosyltransferase involved in cell wall biosynthesis